MGLLFRGERIVESRSEAEKRKHRCCFTGHRPDKITVSEKAVISALEQEIRTTIRDGFNVFITGMAMGTDLWAAEIVIQLRQNEGLPLKLIAASPFDGFEQRWSIAWQKRYAVVMAEADLIRFISPHYHRGCFQVRNEWMVNHSARVIAVFNGEKSGTKNTIDYANKHGIPVRNVL